MAKKKKTSNEPSLLKSLFAGTVMAGSIGYLGLSLYNSLSNGVEMVDALLNFKWNFDWIQSQDDPIRYGLYASPFVFGMLFKAFNRKPNETYSDASKHGVFGDAVFSNLDELKENKFVPVNRKDILRREQSVTKWSEDFWRTLKIPEGIILGREDDELVVLHPNSKLDNRNVLVVGSSGSSKGQAFVIPNLINNYTSSMIVTDPKGELYKLLGEIKRDQGYKVHQVDFFNLIGSKYNPLDYVKTDMDAKKVADSISRNSSKDGKEDFFFNTARDLLVGLILYVKAIKPDASMRDVKKIFNHISDADEGQDRLFEILERIGDNHVAYQFLADASSLGGNTRASVMSSFAQQTGVFSMQAVSAFTERSDFRFEDLQKEKTIIFVKIPVKDNPVAGLTATFFDQLFSILYKIGDENDSILPIPTICLLDEFANLGKLNDYDNILSTCRGYRLSLMTIVQDFAQLEEKYSEKLARTIVNNHDTSLFLRTKDQKTAEYYEKSAGETTVKYETQSKQGGSNWLYYFGFDSQPKQNAPSRSENYTKKSLVSQSTLLNMQGDTCYVFMAGRVLELDKAFQSTIYKGFITASEPVDGKYPYVYSEHREKYIEMLGLEPNEEQPEIVAPREIEAIVIDESNEETEGNGETDDDSVVTTTPVTAQQSSDGGMSSYAKSLMTKKMNKRIAVSSLEESNNSKESSESNEKPVSESEAIQDTHSTQENVEAVMSDPDSLILQQGIAFSIAEMVDKDDIDTEESSKTASELLQIINAGVKTVRQTQEAVEVAETDYSLDTLFGELDSKGSLMQEENESKPNNDVVNVEDELPFG